MDSYNSKIEKERRFSVSANMNSGTKIRFMRVDANNTDPYFRTVRKAK